MACVSGCTSKWKKPELIERLVDLNISFICHFVLIHSNFRVCDYIKYGWDVFLIDPDGGTNVQHKLQTTAAKNKKSLDAILIQSIPRPNDVQWTKHLYKAPKITFGSIYRFLVERKVLLRKANHVENIVDQRDNCTLENVGNKNRKSSGTDAYESIGYTRTLNKAYRFFQDGHVQNIRYHPMPSQQDYVCIGASVLPSMKKDKMYSVRIVLSEHTGHIEKAFCVCPAGLSGCCNHVTATLYCIEDYFHLKLNEDDQKGCTEKLQTWNQPRKKKVDARPTNLVMLTKKVYGVEKRPKACNVNKWDCRPTSRRAVPPYRKANLRKKLLVIDQAKKEAATYAVGTATDDVERKKAIEAQSMLLRYGTSCFLQLLDEEPVPTENRIQKLRDERIARAAAKRHKFQQELSSTVDAVNRDHNYCGCPITASRFQLESVPAPQYLIRNLYEEHVCVSPSRAIEIEACTRNQSLSNLWHEERKLRISASILKTVCHRKADTNVESFIKNKLAPKSINSVAINYGRTNEDTAVSCYIEYQEKRGTKLTVHKCGLFIDPSIPWLAATPDSLVKIGQDTGCLEVKCPFVCAKKSIAAASLEQSSFCLQNSNRNLQLKTSHQYFYQVQAQLYVTRLPWCDFVLWAPSEDIHVERIYYDQQFIENAISKARVFYFDKFLPSVVPCTIIAEGSYQDLRPSAARVTTETSVDKPSAARVATETSVDKSSAARVTTEMSVDKPSAARVATELSVDKPSAARVATETSVDRPSTVRVATEMSVDKPSAARVATAMSVDKDKCKDVEILCSSTVNRPTSCTDLLQQLNCTRHRVIGDGNCLYYAVAHQAGYIGHSSHGDTSVGKQLRTLALICMQNYPGVRTEEGMSQHQWEQKKLYILDQNEWGGDLEVRLLAIGIGKEIVVITGSGDTFTSARRFLCHPPPVPKMRGGIFIPIDVFELSSQWTHYKPSPLLIIYNGINHYDSVKFVNNS